MRQAKARMVLLAMPMAITLLIGLAGCSQGYYGYPGYDEVGSDWDGQVFVDGGYGRDYHTQAFRAEGGRQPVAVGSERGRASMGARASGGSGVGGGGHASSGGGGRATSGGGRK